MTIYRYKNSCAVLNAFSFTNLKKTIFHETDYCDCRVRIQETKTSTIERRETKKYKQENIPVECVATASKQGRAVNQYPWTDRHL